MSDDGTLRTLWPFLEHFTEISDTSRSRTAASAVHPSDDATAFTATFIVLMGSLMLIFVTTRQLTTGHSKRFQEGQVASCADPNNLSVIIIRER